MSGVGELNDVPFPYTDPGFKITLPEDSPNHKVVDMTMPGYDTTNPTGVVYNYIEPVKRMRARFENADDVVKYIQRNANIRRGTYEPLKTLLRTPEFNDFDVINAIYDISIIATVEKIPILRSPVMMVVMNKRIARYILARAFFASPIKNIKFHSLYSSFASQNHKTDCRIKDDVEKLKCIYNYFKRAVDFTDDQLDQKIIFHLSENGDPPPKLVLTGPLVEFQAYDEGAIESHGVGMLQVDFANKHIGGGVLGHGLVQEEIRFLINPELIVGRCIFDTLKDGEAGIIIGTEQFSSYAGYGRHKPNTNAQFKWESDYIDKTSIVSLFETRTRRVGTIRNTAIVAVDAIFLSSEETKLQYEAHNIDREIDKLHAGFRLGLTTVTPIATGNWGSGAFKGDPQLKAMLQWIVASKHNRPVAFFTFKTPYQKDTLHALRSYFSSKGGVEHIYEMLIDYGEYKLASDVNNASLLEWIENHYDRGQNREETARPPRSLKVSAPAAATERPSVSTVQRGASTGKPTAASQFSASQRGSLQSNQPDESASNDSPRGVGYGGGIQNRLGWAPATPGTATGRAGTAAASPARTRPRARTAATKRRGTTRIGS